MTSVTEIRDSRYFMFVQISSSTHQDELLSCLNILPSFTHNGVFVTRAWLIPNEANHFIT